jgi:hypothetical protein
MDILVSIISITTPEVVKIWGTGVRVQIDETAICNGLVVSNPSNRYDNIPEIQWIVGGVVEGNCRQFFLELVPNRKWDTILEVFNECILPGTIIVTDGYPSYPRAVETFCSEHERINHSLGFVNETGGHTNQIENIWSHMKQDYRRKGGINHGRITLWIDEFSWKKEKFKLF